MGVTQLDGNAKDGYQIARGAETLQEVLLKNKIEVLRIFGLVTEVCVRANVLDALDNGYDVEIVADATRGLSPE